MNDIQFTGNQIAGTIVALTLLYVVYMIGKINGAEDGWNRCFEHYSLFF